MLFLIHSTISLEIIAMAASIALVVWSLQIKAGNLLAMVSGVLLFILSVLSLSSTGFYGSKFILGDSSALHMPMKMMEPMHQQNPASPQ